MKIIGITGGIGSGKSTVLKLLERETGCFIIEADILAHRLMEPGQTAYKEIADIFGREILDKDGFIDRDRLGKLVFENNNMLSALNGIVHPAVKKYILSDIEDKKNQGYSLYIIEAALLIEDGYQSICDEIWYIHADMEERIKRLIKTRGGDRKKWESIIKNQSPEDYYRQNCDYVVENGDNLAKTEGIVNELLCK